MADAEKNAETETSEENSVLNVFIAGADTGTGLALTGELVKAGHKVVGSVVNGSEGAFAVRKRGAIPAYADLTRSGEVRSAMQMAKADVVVNLLPTLLNGVPHAQVDADTLLTMLDDSADAIMEAAGTMGVKRVISTSFAFLYQDGENVDESAALNTGSDLYKRAADIEASIRDGGVPAIIVRTGYVYGGYAASFKDLADEMVAGRAVPAGNKSAAWIHDNDLASAIFHLVIKASEDDEAVETIYNVASDNTVSPDA
ncbi:MAG: NAD-dependent epimerase/dehydratase family protein, partial [Aggregatilineales bacterium]